MVSVNFRDDERITDFERDKLRAFCGELGGDIKKLASDLGLVIEFNDMWPYEEGYLEYAPTCGSPSKYRVVVNRAASIERQRFTIAHEIAHFLLHRDKGEFTFRVETRHRSDDPFIYLEPKDKQEEIEAFNFARALLLPPNQFTPAYYRLEGNVAQLSKLFVVSQEVVKIRVRQLKLQKNETRGRCACPGRIGPQAEHSER